MSWISLSDRTRAHFRADGLVRIGQPLSNMRINMHQPMRRGSLLLETQVSPYDRPQLLVGYRAAHSGGTELTLQALPGGGIVLVISRGKETFHTVVNLDTGGRIDTLRITYSWDANARRGRLSVECPGKAPITIRNFENPLPLTLADIQEMTCDRDRCVFANDVAFLAASDRIEPVGPMPTLEPTVPVMTDTGYRPISDIKRGDVVLTLDGSLVPVLANLRRTVPAAGLFAPVKLRAPYFGLTQDIFAAPAQQLVIGGSRVEYLFGAEHVLVPSGNLLNGNAASLRKGRLLVTYCQLMLPDHEAILCAGTYAETLNVGRIRRKNDLRRASLFCTMPRNALPEHSLTAFPVLREFDALTLAAQRAAA
ncbi:Hint domain-containing protein [Shimia abyssi]|uniref:Hint domain-containing protein n=1 Tax=Shimia abyssi TaxID=1662395 RepID=A0A2P8F4D6_9RHOB|nr:Hint domain-containing protein [Shimia abyssi]PSL16565.1 Hint domain-containing protein [Shimia abyssi]